MAPTYFAASSKDGTTSWTSTEFKQSEVLHEWTLSNFSLCREEVGKAIQSSVFGSADGPQWVMKCYPRGHADSAKGFVSLFLTLRSAKNKSGEIPLVDYRCSFWNSKKENIRIFGLNPEFDHWEGDKVGAGHGRRKLIKRDVLIGLLKDDSMTICCEVIICGNKMNSSSQSTDQNKVCFLPIPDCTLSRDHQLMFNCQKFGDITIEVKDKEFLVYQGILETRSPVFAAMFHHEMAERRQNRVVITDFEPRVVEEMLIYMYTGRSPNLEELVNDLLPIADKYGLERLKLMSQEAL